MSCLPQIRWGDSRGRNRPPRCGDMRARAEGRAANRICRCPSTLSSFLAFVSQVWWDLRQTQRLLRPQLKVPGRSAEPHLLPGGQRPRHRHLTPSERAGGIEELSHTRGHCRRPPQSHRLRPPAARGQTKGTTGRSCRVSTLSCTDAQLGALRLTSLSSSARLETRHSGGPLIYTWAH